MPTLAEHIRAFCLSHGLRMNTDLGQHFLIDDGILQKILEAADILPTDDIVEIGPGIGVLTAELLTRAGHVTAIEFDARLIPLLRKYVEENQKTKTPSASLRASKNELTIINDNALHVSFPTTPYKIVANIPYHITSPLLRHAFLEGTRSPDSLTLLIQREVAEKIADTTDGSMLSVIVQLFGAPRIVCHVAPSAFLPPPKVDSSVIHIVSHREPLAEPAIIDEVFTLAKHAFGQKRKMLRNTVSQLPRGDEILKAADIDPTRRPQTLTIPEWISLAKARRSMRG